MATITGMPPLRLGKSILRYLCRNWEPVILPATKQAEWKKVLDNGPLYGPWLAANGIKKYWCITDIDDIRHGFRGGIEFRFKYKHEAILFKLAWT